MKHKLYKNWLNFTKIHMFYLLENDINIGELSMEGVYL